MKRFITNLTVLLALVFGLTNMGIAQQNGNDEFDHFSTGFPLTGAHSNLDCGHCHFSGVFEGTPATCFACHNGIRAIGKPINHIRSVNACDDCHTTYSMLDVRFDHGNVIDTCRSCHNGVISIGRVPNHLPQDQCEECHNSITFSSPRFNHQNLNVSCFGCHNGSYVGVPPKHTGHPPTSNICEDCHAYPDWSNILPRPATR